MSMCANDILCGVLDQTILPMWTFYLEYVNRCLSDSVSSLTAINETESLFITSKIDSGQPPTWVWFSPRRIWGVKLHSILDFFSSWLLQTGKEHSLLLKDERKSRKKYAYALDKSISISHEAFIKTMEKKSSTGPH